MDNTLVTVLYHSLPIAVPEHSSHDSLYQVGVDQMNSPDLHEQNSDTESTTPEAPESQVQPDSPADVEYIVFEPLDHSPYDLFYTCLLIPRFNTHYLTGDLAQRLPVWLQQICISFGWRLEQITVKPEYFQWILRVPPATSTAYVMRTIRRQTSILIFDDFPRFKHENVSKDFWAPGYLIYFGAQPHPVEVIQNFIRYTRQQQGILPNV